MFERFKHRLGRKRSEVDLGPTIFDPPLRLDVEIDALLVGSQAGRPLERWIRETGELGRASLRLVDSPYVSFLRQIRLDPKRLDDDALLRATDYYRMAKRCADHTGKWFGAREEAGILERVRAFGRMLPELAGGSGPELAAMGGEPMQGRTPVGEPVRLFAVRDSRCYELQDGHHRAALAAVGGQPSIAASVGGDKWSYLQSLVLQGVQTRGRQELYQPLKAPEFDGSWTLVRRCADRFAMMERFLRERGLSGEGRTSLDLASSYGWFVRALADHGFDAHGVERDDLAVRIGLAGYRLPPDKIRVMSVERFLEGNRETYDVVLFLSILHHFVIGRESAGLFAAGGDAAARKLIRHVERACGRVLFFDTGEEQETWMRDKLPGWTPEFIARWLKENTSFSEIVPLGRDEDVLSFPGNYARTLFACVKRDASA